MCDIFYFVAKFSFIKWDIRWNTRRSSLILIEILSGTRFCMLANNCYFGTCQKVCAYQKTKMCASALEWSPLNVIKHWVCHEKEAQFGKIVSLNEHVSDWKRWRNESVQSQSQSHSHKPETKLNFNQHWFILIEESRWVSFCLCIFDTFWTKLHDRKSHQSHHLQQ